VGYAGACEIEFVEQVLEYGCKKIGEQNGDDQSSQRTELLYDTFVVTVYQSVSENGANDNIYNLYVHRCPVKKR